MKAYIAGLLAASLLTMTSVAGASMKVFEKGGRNAADIQSTVDAYRKALGDLNDFEPGSEPDGRREINWDGVPDELASPNPFPQNFFNEPISGRARGVVFFTPGIEFQVSANEKNPTNTAPRFGNLDPDLANQFGTFSPERLFTAVESRIVEILFFEPGFDKPATTNGFGAVFTDVDQKRSTKIEYLDIKGNLLFAKNVPQSKGGKKGLSFLGVKFDREEVYMVRITVGRALPLKGGESVAMDDFIYGEPQPIQ